MRLPRWLVVSLLTVSVLALPGAAAWWWVSWPDRTARQFVERMTSDQNDRSWIKLMVRPADFGSVKMSYDPYNTLKPPEDWRDVQPQQRSFRDLLDCRHRFKTSG